MKDERVMKKVLSYIVVVLGVSVLAIATGGEVHALKIVYQNDFESPNGIFFGPYYIDLSQQNLNYLYGPEIQMKYTVETLGIEGPHNLYSDPSGIGGEYAIGMLESAQNDLAAITFDVEELSFVNVSVDVAGIGIKGINGPFVNDNPVFSITLLDTPGGKFNMGSVYSYKSLDSVTVSGVMSSDSIFTFDWTNNFVSLNTEGTSDGNVTLLIDLIEGGYAALDNLVVITSDTPNPSPEPTTLVLFGTGLMSMFIINLRKKLSV